MNRNNRTGSRLFFIEFLIVLFFFLIVSTVCLRLFVRAHVITRDADILSHARAAAASVAAAVESARRNNAEELLAGAAEYLPDVSLTSLADDSGSGSREGLAAAYDEEFRTCGIEEAYFLLTAVVDVDGNEETLNISVRDYDQTTIYELTVVLHRPVTRKEALS